MTCEAGRLVYLGLGSNLGDRAANLRRGLELLARAGFRLLACSSLYETAPWGGVEQPDFYNLAVSGQTQLEPRQLLALLKDIERQVGRKPGVRWGARILDIDILLYEELTFFAEGLIIPHKEMGNRAFVLAPLLEIAPDLAIPAEGGSRKAADFWAALPERERRSVRLVGPLI